MTYLYNAPAANTNDTLAMVTPDKSKVYLIPKIDCKGKNTIFHTQVNQNRQGRSFFFLVIYLYSIIL